MFNILSYTIHAFVDTKRRNINIFFHTFGLYIMFGISTTPYELEIWNSTLLIFTT